MNKNFYNDFYRNTGFKFKLTPEAVAIFLLSHHIRYLFLLRKAQNKPSIFNRMKLKKYSSKYGLEISPYAKIVNCVYVGINSTVVGGIEIGDDVLIAPNSFVNFNVPPHSVVVGNPAKIHQKENATQGYIAFTF